MWPFDSVVTPLPSTSSGSMTGNKKWLAWRLLLKKSLLGSDFLIARLSISRILYPTGGGTMTIYLVPALPLGSSGFNVGRRASVVPTPCSRRGLPLPAVTCSDCALLPHSFHPFPLLRNRMSNDKAQMSKSKSKAQIFKPLDFGTFFCHLDFGF